MQNECQLKELFKTKSLRLEKNVEYLRNKFWTQRKILTFNCKISTFNCKMEIAKSKHDT